jgi:perosamine synthetase
LIPLMTERKMISIAHPLFSGNERKYVLECLDSSWISSTGKFIGMFEEAFAGYCGAAYGVACNNGTSALHLALLALGVQAGDEVIVPTLTYIATANAVRYCNAVPVFVDSESATMNLDANRIEERLTQRTKGIIVVHLYGHPVDMAPILELARKRNLFVLEDAAEAHGALYRGQRTGSLGDAATFSFYGNKIITTGEGGMVTTGDARLNAGMRLLRGQGMDPGRRYWFPVIGYNYRMTNIQAAIGLAQFEQIQEHLDTRLRIAGWYGSALSSFQDFVTLPSVAPWAKHSFWSYTILLKNRALGFRDGLMEQLAADGIETRPVFFPLHTLPPYKEHGERFPVAERLSSEGVSLPIHGLLTESDVLYIVERLLHYCRS